MSLLAPLFLFGLGLLALPIWLHRIQVEAPDRETFASTMFLEAAQKRVHVRRQLKYLLLMAARLLMLALLVLAFAQPQLSTPSVVTGTGAEKHVLLMDVSVSMSAKGVFERATEQAQALIDDLGVDSSMQIYSFSNELKTVAPETSDPGVLDNAVRQLEPTSIVSNFGSMMAALSRVDGLSDTDADGSSRYEIHVISDFQQTAMPERYADLIPSIDTKSPVNFNFYSVAAESKANWAVDYVRDEGAGLRVGVRGFDTPAASVEIQGRLGDEVLSRQSLEVPAAGRANVLIPVDEYPPGTTEVSIELLSDDVMAADNAYYLPVDREPPQSVLLLTDSPNGNAVTYLSAAIESISKQTARQSAAHKLQVVSFAELDARTLQRYRWLIVDDLGSLPSTLENQLKDYVESGGAVFAAMGPRTSALGRLPITDHKISNVALVQANQTFSPTQVNRSHRVLTGLTGWSNLTISRAVSLELQAEDQTLLGLDNGVPLLVEHALGRGRLMLLTSGLDKEWNNLVIKPLFVSLMAELGAYLSKSTPVRTQGFAGETIGMVDSNEVAGQLIDPDGNELLGLNNTRRLGSYRLNQTGFYQLVTATNDITVGVNLHPSESDLGVVQSEVLEQWRASLNAVGGSSQQSATTGAVARSTVNSNMRDLYLGLLIAGVLFCLFESLIANRYLARRSAGSVAGAVT